VLKLKVQLIAQFRGCPTVGDAGDASRDVILVFSGESKLGGLVISSACASQCCKMCA